ncbi:hypothetical protein [Catenuloplanes japonicus]|uniref:hypothetical protein n=1 Tax=Catenuloplanes japonicus TaxID=33876 RepID=UPI000526A935|nr:hypothetical protein [Catenuloplanes japonicus]
MTTLTRQHDTIPEESGMVRHLWSVSAGSDTVTLSALQSALDLPGIASLPKAARDLTAETRTGTWLFNVLGAGHNGIDDQDAFGHATAGPVWAEIAAAGVTDDAVYGQLETIHAQVFGGAA